MDKPDKEKFSKYEETRVLGARALQISMNAPLLKKISPEQLEKTNYDPMEISREELDAGVLPITVNQPLPQKRSIKIKKTVEKKDDKEIIASEEAEEEAIAEKGEIMALAQPGDEDAPEEIATGREASEELQ